MKQDVEIVFTKILKMVKASLSILAVLLMAMTAYGQELIPVGTWRSHFNYEQTYLVEKTTSKLFAATAQGLMYYDPEDRSINKLSKVDGLSDVSVSALAYNGDAEYLALGYQNGNVDIITSDGIKNLPVLLNSNVTENKKVNHISFYDGHMNLATDFGLLVLTAENQVIEAYQNLGENGEVIKIRASAILNDILYLATDDGVIAGGLTTGDNLQDFNNWERFSSSPIYNQDIVYVAMANGNIYAASEGSLYKHDGDSWLAITLLLNVDEQITKIRSGSNSLLILTNQRVLTASEADVVTEINFTTEADINDVLQEDQNTFWYADESLGLSKMENGSAEHIVLSGPLNNIKKIKIVSGEVYALPELSTNYTTTVSNKLGYSFFGNGEWTTVKPEEIIGMTNISDIMAFEDGLLVSSFGQGILDNQINHIVDFTNSPLDERETDTGNTLVSGLAEDNAGNIWVANFSANSLMKWDGEDLWEAFNFGSSAAEEPTSISINENDQLWMTLGLSGGRGILAYDIEAEVSRYITTTSTSLPSSQVNDIAFGKDNEVWMATDLGLAYFPFSFGIIEDQTVDVSLPIFDQSILFQDKQVNALAVDGGNRLWVGTQEGLWLFEEGFSSLIEYFTVDNSPLPSNSVMDLAIHPQTGELFILTEEGIVSYRTASTEGTNVHHQVKIFPNPVLPDFEGWVGLSGLANNVRVKITTVSGQLIREINAAGGGASWDVRDYSGRRVSTGVYLVFSASLDGNETFVGKIAVID